MLGRFNKIFGIQENLSAEQDRFVQRINQTVFDRVEHLAYPTSYEKIFRHVCYRLGINAGDRIGTANRGNYGSHTILPGLRTLTHDDFRETLKILVLLYEFFQAAREQQEMVANWIEIALNNATIDIGVTWNEGMFYPSGAKELDERLIEEPLEWLRDFPNERHDYLAALTGYANNRLDEVIGNCYLVVEGIARSVLKNSRTLDNNREALVRTMELSQEWKSLLNNFINYANEFKRHASEGRHSLNPIEVEGFLYMTGILVRMICEGTKRISA